MIIVHLSSGALAKEGLECCGHFKSIKILICIENVIFEEIKLEMMSLESRKLQIIGDFLKVSDTSIIEKAEKLLRTGSKQKAIKKNIQGFAGLWSESEANEMREIIDEGCEQINDEDW